MAGVVFGLACSFHTYIAYRVIPGAIALTLIALWLSLRAVFHHEKYVIARHQQLGGAALMVGVMLLTIIPMVSYFYANPQDFTGRTGQVAVWASDHPAQALATNVAKTLACSLLRETPIGATTWLVTPHSVAGGGIFAMGSCTLFGDSFTRWKHRGHPDADTMLLSWFFVGLLPAFLSTGRIAACVARTHRSSGGLHHGGYWVALASCVVGTTGMGVTITQRCAFPCVSCPAAGVIEFVSVAAPLS